MTFLCVLLLCVQCCAMWHYKKHSQIVAAAVVCFYGVQKTGGGYKTYSWIAFQVWYMLLKRYKYLLLGGCLLRVVLHDARVKKLAGLFLLPLWEIKRKICWPTLQIKLIRITNDKWHDDFFMPSPIALFYYKYHDCYLFFSMKISILYERK